MNDVKESKDIKKVRYYLKKSFKLTKGYKKLFKLIVLLILFVLITFPVNYL